jgi:hypothetical protein
MTGAGPDKGPRSGHDRQEARDNAPLTPVRTGGKG